MDQEADPARLPNLWWPLLRRADQVTLAVLIGGLVALIVLRWMYQAAFHDQLIEIDRAPPCPPDFWVQINEADWPELTLLPGIGLTLAQRIVADRQQHGPFGSVEQLERVKGIGPKTVRRLRPFVRLAAADGPDQVDRADPEARPDSGPNSGRVGARQLGPQ